MLLEWLLTLVVAIASAAIAPAPSQGTQNSRCLEFSLVWTTSSTRDPPATALEGSAFGVHSPNLCVYVSPVTDLGGAISYVNFSIDGTFYKREALSPYDLAGTSYNGEASCLTMQALGLNAGPHTITAAFYFSDMRTCAVSSAFSICPFSLMWSTSPTREAPTALNGASLPVSDAPLCIFLSPLGEATVSTVAFSLDGQTQRTELHPPFDFNGGDATIASCITSHSLSMGSHVIDANVTLTSGAICPALASFEIISAPIQNPTLPPTLLPTSQRTSSAITAPPTTPTNGGTTGNRGFGGPSSSGEADDEANSTGKLALPLVGGLLLLLTLFLSYRCFCHKRRVVVPGHSVGSEVVIERVSSRPTAEAYSTVGDAPPQRLTPPLESDSTLEVLT